LPVVLERLANATGDVFIADLDREFATAVEAARGRVDRANDDKVVVGHEQLGMQLNVLELVDLEANLAPALADPYLFVERCPSFVMIGIFCDLEDAINWQK
jgi:hypothetical protein